MEIPQIVKEGGAQLGCALIVGTATAAVLGSTALTGATIAAVAYLATAVAYTALQKALNDGGNLHSLLGRIAVGASWATTVTMISQQALLAIGLTVTFWPAFTIAGASVIGGILLGDAVIR